MGAQAFPIDQDLTSELGALSDDELLRRLSDLLGRSRRVESEVVAHIAEAEERRLYAREACPSMFAYCTEVLHLSEQEAYLRITVARAARAHPMLLAMLADGRLHLSAIAKLAPHLTTANRDVVLARAVHRSKRRIEELVAELAPVPDVPALIRKLPERRAGEPVAPVVPASDNAPRLQLCPDRASTAPAPVPVRRPIVRATAPARYKVQFTASAAFRDKLDRLKALMREALPDGDLADLLEDAVTEKLRRLEARRFARTKTPRKDLAAADTSAGSPYIPAPVRRVVDERDGRQCRYVTQDGRRCGGRARLEFHHGPQAHARGGDRTPENIQLMCRAHNVHLAEREFGSAQMARYRRPGRQADVTAPSAGERCPSGCVILEAPCRNHGLTRT